MRAPSDVFRVTWGTHVLSGQGTRWVADGATTRRRSQGELELRLTFHAADVPGATVVKTYVIYPKESIIQEWLQVRNRSHEPVQIVDPAALYVQMAQGDRADVTLSTMSGAGTWRWRHDTLPALGGDVQFSGSGSNSQAPIQAYFNRVTRTGVFVGWDCISPWTGAVRSDQTGRVEVEWAGRFDSALQPGDSISSATAFTGTYHGDLDDLGHRMLDYQYRYKWDYTRAPYFPGTLMEGYWAAGSSYRQDQLGLGGKYDPVSTYRKIFHLADMFRTIGNDVYWRDNGWWDNEGDWNGPDFRETNRYLNGYGMQELIYIPIYDAAPGSKVHHEHPDWGSVLDQSLPAVQDWEVAMLESRQRLWGNFLWRKDWSAISGGSDKALRQDQGFRHVIQTFLDRNPGMTYQGCDGGGNDVTYEMLRYAASWTLSDNQLGVAGLYDASYIFPPDKIEDLVDAWNPRYYNKLTWRGLLQGRPTMIGETENPSKLEGIRQLFDIYHYLAHEGVIGRWVWVYHPPVVGDSAMKYLQRMSRDSLRGLVVIRRPSPTPVTVYPKGLLPGKSYHVSFQETGATAWRMGADLMMHGITMPRVLPGELIYLNLPLHPGSTADHTPPASPSHVTQTQTEHMDYTGVAVHWTPARDNSWVSYYEISRNGVVIGTAANSTYYFDHALGADLMAQYAVTAVDGSGNRSPPAAAAGVSVGTPDIVLDDTNAALKYTGNGWRHQTGAWSVAHGTLARTRTAGNALEYTFTGNGVTWIGQMGRGQGVAAVYIDSLLDRLVTTFSADEIPNVAVYSRKFPTVGTHTIRIVATGAYTDTVKLWDNTEERGWITVDGMQVERRTPHVVGAEPRFGIRYRGRGWQHAGASRSSASGDRAEYTFAGRGITWVGPRCEECGIADVYVDGVLQTSVDTYTLPINVTMPAPPGSSEQTISLGANQQQSVPLFTTRWGKAGTHTIAIVVRPDANLQAKGHAVAIESLQVEP